MSTELHRHLALKTGCFIAFSQSSIKTAFGAALAVSTGTAKQIKDKLRCGQVQLHPLLWIFLSVVECKLQDKSNTEAFLDFFWVENT